jgi:uncharacterized SAM-dependent methyltransferase
LFDDEVELIKKNQKIITHYLSNVESILEIGPGSNYSVTHKTFNMLEYAKKLKYYYPIDICKSYLVNACNLIKKSNPALKITPLEADMLNISALNLSTTIKNSKAIMLLGSTLGGQTPVEQNQMLEHIYNSLNEEDLFIITCDTNNDEELLLKAYQNNEKFHRAPLRLFSKLQDEFKDCFLRAPLRLFAKINPQFKDRFDIHCAWNKEFYYVDIFFVAQKKLTFYYPDKGIIKINKGQELRGIKSRKYSKEKIKTQLEDKKFIIKEIVTNSNKMEMFICKKE